MNTNNDLPINSYVHDPEVSLELIDKEVIQDNDKMVSKSKFKAFSILSCLALFMFHSPMLLIIILFLIKGSTLGVELHHYFMGPDDVYFNYAIVLTIVLFTILIVASVYPKFARNGFQYPIFIILNISMFYLIVYGMCKQAKGTYDFNAYKILIHFCYSFFNSSFALLVASFFTNTYVPKQLPFIITCSGQLFFGLMLTYYTEISRRIAAEYVAYSIFAILLTLYYCYDLEMMIFYRPTQYKHTDWFLGFVHLNTDIAFRFWRDLIRFYIMKEEIEPELNLVQPEMFNEE
jgi:hypothetical protein